MMKRISIYPIQYILSSICSVLVCMNILSTTEFMIYPVCFIFNFICFALFFLVLDLKNKGWILYSVITLVYSFITYIAYIWSPDSLLYIIMISIYAVASMIFYFSVRLIRIPIITLILFIVFTHGIRNGILYATNGFIISLVCYIALFVIHGQGFNKEKNLGINNSLKAKRIIFFTVITFLISILIPIPKNIPKLPLIGELQNLLTDYGFEGGNLSAFNTIKNTHSRNINDDVIEPDNTQIYTIKSTEPLYLRVKSFSTYENNTFINDEKYERGYVSNNYDKFYSFKNIYDLRKVITSEEAIKLKSLGLDFSYKLSNTIYEREAVVTSINFPTKGLYLSTANTKFIDTENEKNLLFYAPSGIIFDPKNDVLPNERYTIYYYTQDIPENSFEKMLVDNMSQELASELLELSIKYKNDDILDLLNSPTHFNSSMSYEDTLSIEKLSKEIIGTETNIITMCKKIEDYLKNGDFEYSLSVNKVAPDENFIKEFLFKSKKGYCVQYASSMTIMLQSLGIPSRYVEGFYSNNKNPLNSEEYIVTLKDAHSYVEVYIPGYGWRVFDPTPSRDKVNSIGDINSTEAIKSLFKYKISGVNIYFIIFLLVGIICYLIISKEKYKIKNMLFIYKIKKLDPNEGVSYIIPYLIKDLERRDYPLLEGKTLSEYAYILNLHYNLDINKFVESYYKVKYEEGEVSMDCYINLIICLKEILKL